ncbi:hypothetical protein B0I35DRAFT_439788 [Stachybotrys elegans]|uniref:Uncharacterized protein n=1 Tax=Stachybotrys elegans TaxID=80388 RepID=A0A8K0SQ27_9HYPO|nr:hypothetical protein B0I35DRAFT_439788 [Stachybotrys elegans]
MDAPASIQPALPGCQWLVPYGTFLPQISDRHVRFEASDRNGSRDSWWSGSESDDRSSDTQSTRPRVDFYSTTLPSSEFVAEDVMKFERNERLERAKGEYITAVVRTASPSDIAQDAFLSPWRFAVPRHISLLYPRRYRMAPAVDYDCVDLPNLVNLCEEMRYVLQTTVLPSWQHLTTLIPLIEERLLCCTGDPELRLDACWDRRPRGTFLDFGSTRAEPHMPKQWSFLAHCKPETLVSILIEVIEAMNEVRKDMDDEWATESDAQAWYTTPVGNVLERCYARRILIQPLMEEHSKYEKHVIYVLAAIELINTCSKSKRAKTPGDIFSRTALDFDTVDQLLQRPLSEIANRVLYENFRGGRSRSGSRTRSGKLDAFPTAHLKVPVLKRIGFLKVDWTEYMEEHLKFDTTTMTVSIFWFFSHIYDNASWHLFCDRYGCPRNHHSGARRDRSRTRDLTYRQEVMHSYRWLFSEDPGEALEQLLELPIPWWLVPLEDENVSLPWHRSGTWIEKQHLSSSKGSRWAGLFSKVFRFTTGKYRSEVVDKRPTLRTLLKDMNGHRCELPVDCKDLLEYLDEEVESITRPLPYERYPELGPRVRILMQFMEKQKPRGLLALWRDKRDSTSWYTFWTAVVLGVAAFMLALASVGLSGARTWASFQALGRESRPEQQV